MEIVCVRENANTNDSVTYVLDSRLCPTAEANDATPS